MSRGAIQVGASEVDGGARLAVHIEAQPQFLLDLGPEEVATLLVGLYRVSGQDAAALTRNYRAAEGVR